MLIRAIEPQSGLEGCRRVAASPARRCCAPAPRRLCRALGIDRSLDGLPLDRVPFAFSERQSTPAVVAGPRIGISRAVETPRRFGLPGFAFPQPQVLTETWPAERGIAAQPGSRRPRGGPQAISVERSDRSFHFPRSAIGRARFWRVRLMTDFFHAFLLVYAGLFPIVNPIGSAPIFPSA